MAKIIVKRAFRVSHPETSEVVNFKPIPTDNVAPFNSAETAQFAPDWLLDDPYFALLTADGHVRVAEGKAEPDKEVGWDDEPEPEDGDPKPEGEVIEPEPDYQPDNTEDGIDESQPEPQPEPTEENTAPEAKPEGE
jgi:hypothetical protein